MLPCVPDGSSLSLSSLDHSALRESDLPGGELRRIEADGAHLLLVRRNGLDLRYKRNMLASQWPAVRRTYRERLGSLGAARVPLYARNRRSDLRLPLMRSRCHEARIRNGHIEIRRGKRS